MMPSPQTGDIQRETSLKTYRCEWKINLIERDNPIWDDLFPEFFVAEGPLARLQPHRGGEGSYSAPLSRLWMAVAAMAASPTPTAIWLRPRTTSPAA